MASEHEVEYPDIRDLSNRYRRQFVDVCFKGFGECSRIQMLNVASVYYLLFPQEAGCPQTRSRLLADIGTALVAG